MFLCAREPTPTRRAGWKDLEARWITRAIRRCYFVSTAHSRWKERERFGDWSRCAVIIAHRDDTYLTQPYYGSSYALFLYGYTILVGVAPSSNSSPRPIFLPLASNAIDAAANAAPALAPRVVDPFLNPTTAPAANPPSAPFHASFAFRALSLAHAVVANAHPIAPNSAAPLPTAPIVLASAGALLARTIAGASEPPSAARAHPTTAPNADDVIVAAIARSKHDADGASALTLDDIGRARRDETPRRTFRRPDRSPRRRSFPHSIARSFPHTRSTFLRVTSSRSRPFPSRSRPFPSLP